MGFNRAERKGEVTALLMAWNSGDKNAPNELVRVVYAELRKLAKRLLDRDHDQHTLQTTAVIHEVYFRLVGSDLHWQNSGHFFAVAAQAMRQLLVDRARRREREKRVRAQIRVSLSHAVDAAPEAQLDVLALNDALSELEKTDERCSQVLELRYFGGLTVAEAAKVLGVSPATVKNDWTFARSWLHRRLKERGPALPHG